MQRGYLQLLFVLPLFILAAGCGKGSDGTGENNGPHVNNPLDTVPPVILVQTPVTDQVYKSGDVIGITGKVTDGDGLYQGSIRITNDANGSVIADQGYVIHGLTQYNFSFSHTVSVVAASNYTVTVSFEDHGLNTVSQPVKIKVNP